MSLVKVIALIMLVSIMLTAGLAVNRAQLVATLKDGGLLARAFLANFILVPVIAVILARLFRLDDFVATGILLMAIAPGVPFLPVAAGAKKGGSMEFAVCLAFLMPALSILTIPVTARLVLPAQEVAQIPWSSLTINLVAFQLVPLLAGMAIAARAPSFAARFSRVTSIAFLLTVIAVLIVLSPTIVSSLGTMFGTYGLFTALLVVVLSLAAGWTLGGPDASCRRTLSLATGLRNIGAASLLATTSFPGTIVSAEVMSYLIIQIVVVMIAGKFYSRGMETPAVVHG